MFSDGRLPRLWGPKIHLSRVSDMLGHLRLKTNNTKNVMTTKFPNTISWICERWLSERSLECIVEIEVLSWQIMTVKEIDYRRRWSTQNSQ
jgi:hypothetical protein